MATLDELIEELRDQGREEDAGELEKLSGSTLRKKAQDADKFEKQLADAIAKVERLERAPKAEKAFKDAGVDFDQLSKLERKAIESYAGELDEEAIGSFIEENELSVEEGSDEGSDDDEEPAAAKVAKAARRSDDGKRGSKTPKVSPEDISKMPMDERFAFREANPETWDRLMRGETVTGTKVPLVTGTVAPPT